jgi:hypothetical protein
LNPQLLLAGFLATVGAAIHGVGGEVFVMRRLSARALSPSAIGGPRMTRAMIHVTWHLTTVAFLATGVALLFSGSILEGDSSRSVGLLCAATSTGFAAVVVGMGAAESRSPRFLFRHPAALLLTATAALAWWGAASI